MAKKRVAIKKVNGGYLVTYGGTVKDFAITKREADNKANTLRVKHGKKKR
ncbi:MAG: hypothetical protein KAJ39_09385 [Gammaproteobacteria bacterium]|nr:hypothetical protein [Gammaproteobacteria bacterium]